MIICIKRVKIKRVTIVNCSNWQIIKSKESMALFLQVREHSRIIPQFQSSQTGFQNGKHMLTIEKSECLPHNPAPRSPAFIDTLSSCQRDGTQESYLSSFFFFFKTKFTVSRAYIWHGWCKTYSSMTVFPRVCTCYICNVDGK